MTGSPPPDLGQRSAVCGQRPSRSRPADVRHANIPAAEGSQGRALSSLCSRGAQIGGGRRPSVVRMSARRTRGWTRPADVRHAYIPAAEGSQGRALSSLCSRGAQIGGGRRLPSSVCPPGGHGAGHVPQTSATRTSQRRKAPRVELCRRSARVAHRSAGEGAFRRPYVRPADTGRGSAAERRSRSAVARQSGSAADKVRGRLPKEPASMLSR
jgi:hypothetical protein